jgi:hypothetical protein
VVLLKIMSKREIKKKIKEAIEKNPFKKDIKKVSLFGSYTKETNREDSDVDVLIEFEPSATVGFFKFVEIQDDIGDYIGKSVDLLTPEAISQHFREEVLNQSELIYGE